MTISVVKRLEQYTIKFPQEVLIVNVEVEGEGDQIAIFKGFSSSLMRPTAFDPDVPILPESANILTIDRVKSPYNPENPQYIQSGLTWNMMQLLLAKTGL